MSESTLSSISQQKTPFASVRNTIPSWIKYSTIASLVLAGIFWLLPQYEYVGEEYHTFWEYYDYYNLGTQGASSGFLVVVWLVLIAAAASVWVIDRPDRPLGQFTWVSVPLILLAMILVAAGQATPEDTIPPVDDRNWTAFYWEATSQHSIVWIWLWVGLLGAVGTLVYPRLRKAPLSVATTATDVIAPGDPREPKAASQPDLEQKLDEINRLRAADKITDDEHAALRQRILTER